MPKLKSAALVISGVLAASAARADVVYTFTTTSATNTRNSNTLGISLVYDLTDAQVATGGFTLSGIGNGGFGPGGEALFSYTGDISGFSSLTFATVASIPGYSDTDTITPYFIRGNIQTTLAFDAAGNVTSSFVDWLGYTAEEHLSGTGNTALGYAGSDANICFGGNPGNACSVTGVWSETRTSPVPEPATFAMLGAGLVGLVGLRRQLTVCSIGEA